MSPWDRADVQPPRRERAINAPIVVVALVLFLVGAHAARVLAGGDALPLTFSQGDLARGRLAGLVTYQFVHATWAHVLMNAAFVLAFGAPVARYFGETWRGAAVFLVYFLLCGIIAALGYAGLMALPMAAGGEGPWSLLGASGAGSGLMGGAARLIGRPGGMTPERRDGRLGAFSSPSVVAITLGWIAINVVFGVTGLMPGTGGAPVAWQAHIVGYFAGLLLLAPFGWVFGDRATPP